MSYYKIENLEQYFKHYNKSVREPRKFWERIADENFTWYQRWDKILEYDMEKANFNWFVNAKLNITKNCLDRHLNKRGNKPAIIFESNNPSETKQHLTYTQLHQEVCKMTNVLKDLGVKKGDTVCIYLPMIPELVIAMLACARIGAIHAVVFAGFSSSALNTRITNTECKFIITSDGSYRGDKTIQLKPIVDEAIENNTNIQTVLVVKRTNSPVDMKMGRDRWLQPLLDDASSVCTAEVMDAEDPLFILYTSGSTGKPKGMVHTIGGYMVYTAYTFKNVFNYDDGDVFWCTADIGWITGHSYIVYGPLLNGATTIIYEGTPSYPDFGRFWQIIERHKVNQFYTAPTAIRSLSKESTDWVKQYNLSSLKVIGTVGEPINQEAWHWYNNHVGNKRCPITDTWWQTETGGVMIAPIPFVTPTKPTYATFPLPGVQLALMDDQNNEIASNQASGNLCIKFPWPGMARTIWKDHQRFIDTYFKPYPGKYFTGDGALRDEVGYYRITGRVDDVIIVSGHNLGTAPIEDAINEHPAVAESAVVGYPHPLKGNALYGYITLKQTGKTRDQINLRNEINQHIASHVGSIAKLDKIQFVLGLPKTRSGKIMRRILLKIAQGDFSDYGDTSTLINPESIALIQKDRIE
ncbi:MAG: acetate--CoA ligase [Bacteroidota bacterium]|nr:acetate--CoA ligase [Bacteroidota bacterium]